MINNLQNKVRDTTVTLRGLVPSSDYAVLIYTESAVSGATPAYSLVDVRTLATDDWTVGELRVAEATDTRVTLEWETPTAVVSH